MSKRARNDQDAGPSDQPPKRVRQNTRDAPAVTSEPIHAARQLSELLSFHQDDGQHARHGIASFKLFLEEILYRRDEDTRSQKLSILNEFLESQRPADQHDTDHPFLSQLWQTWSFASSGHNDVVVSSVAAILALLIKTLSSLLEFKELGLLLCKTVLQGQHLRLIKRALEAPINKEHLISPNIRLLTEVVGFDGGALAREVYKRREQTFDIANVRRNLGVSRRSTNEEEDRRKPSVRTLTVRYVLSLLRYLHEGGKNDILKNKPISNSLLFQLREDPVDLVHEVLSITQQHILKDDEIPRSTKATLLTVHNLEKVASIAAQSTEEHGAADRAFAWLKDVCTLPSYGILRKSAWYPAGCTFTDMQRTDISDAINLGLDSVEFYDKARRPDVRNPLLLKWLLTLRPHADLRVRELVMACFEAAPELVAAYFIDSNTSLEPKLTNTWIGHAAFIFEVVNLPIPANVGNVEEDGLAQLPPQVSIMLQNLLPEPLTQKVLTKCINQDVGLISFFATRILVLTLQKLAKIRANLALKGGIYARLWLEASDRLLSEFLLRCPPLKDLVASFRKIPDDEEHQLHKEASARVLRLYYEVAPVQACEEPFDISTVFATALVQVSESSDASQSNVFRRQTLEHYLAIAQHGSAMKWFNKHGQLTYTPITTLIKLQAAGRGSAEIHALIARILTSNNVLNTSPTLEALVASLLDNAEDAEIWGFLDDCLARASRSPVKYLDDLEALSPRSSDAAPCVLSGAIAEQASFAKDRTVVIEWCLRFLVVLVHMSGPSKVLSKLQKQIKDLRKPRDPCTETHAEALVERVRASLPQRLESEQTSSQAIVEASNNVHFESIPAEPHDRPEILRWARKDLEAAFEDGDVAALILCLCSKHSPVRRQALQQLHVLWAKLQEATLEDKQCLSILIGELLETFDQQHVQNDTPLPYLAGTFATLSIKVLLEPAHYIYPKINRFLIKSPEWRPSKMPSYWLANTFSSKPEEDDAFWKEVQWVLNWLVDGLRSEADLNILRRSGALAKVLGISQTPKAGYQAIHLKALELLYRALQLEKGAETLVTRLGILPWLKTKPGRNTELLEKMILDAGDGERLKEWAGKQICAITPE